METSRIKNFYLIEKELNRVCPDNFYQTPDGEEAIAPVDKEILHKIVESNGETYNPHLEGTTFILKCLFSVPVMYCKNYDQYEIILGKKLWILTVRMYDGPLSILAVTNKPK